MKARAIAFYLPQFHPIPENDAWWGKGFTEWTNTAKAKPLFRGHYQPHVPADLGFYDLRVPETRQSQADMAAAYGIEGFCYYHYWFAGKRLLERPFDEVLNSGRPDYPFCVCWANDPWSGVWHGAPDRILIDQTYPGEEDHRAHFSYLLPAFKDPRYLRVGGAPMFVVYRPTHFPDARGTADLWRAMARAAGLPGLHLVGVGGDDWDPAQHGFDAVVTHRLPSLRPDLSMRHHVEWARRRLEKYRNQPTVYRYADIVPLQVPDVKERRRLYPALVHAWDNSPRSGANGRVLTDPNPEYFRQVLRRTLEWSQGRPAEDRIIFLKSWNEWAEGNHLEPDLRYGRSYLDVIREEIL